MAVIGIDIGSRSIERVVWDQATGAWTWDKVPTTFDPLTQCRKLLADADGCPVVATGYGRALVAEHFAELSVRTITEIQAYARGVHHLVPEARTVVDIGGQDTKVIALSPQGAVVKFEMNDRCAAGTGKFLEFMATSLQIPLDSFGDFALEADKQVAINSMCTVFAESEATSLMARGERPQNIAMALHRAIVRRTLAMLRRVGGESPVVFAGGVAHNRCVCRLLSEALGGDVIVPPDPDVLGALGAALAGAGP
ncbi:CoA-substrate-specific enzyme activase, putative [Desulfacinum hydrothermale DSM 13146]|uniref:CoA-substrate-specific enzyme activase, putative n=1 Tax=Desulfacinum hydrothermale DSM 13146 TaxID=1121390 RepID=A0A1W1XF86_9BACT|nr:acyl-CoA dehydratase activase [Desulfacinum hydrothermale]SMC22599.1 CoA-substrate-specific enzyme activase, putative [Desulfacinum hydrothermale DSM 13146]